MEKSYIYVALCGILSGFLVFGGQIFINLGLSVYEISIIPYLMVAILLLPFIIYSKKYRPKGNPLIWILYGVASGLTILAQYAALILGVPVAMVVLLLYTQPLWTLLISKIFFKEDINKRSIFACFLVFIGVVVLVNPFGVTGIRSLTGVLIALAGGLTLSGWVVLGSFTSKKNNHPISIKFTETTISMIFMLLILPLLLIFTKNPALTSLSLIWSAKIYVYLVIYAIFAILLNHMFYFVGMKKVPTVSGGVILLLEPVVAAILSVIFLKQAMTINLILGGILILIANYLVIKSHK